MKEPPPDPLRFVCPQCAAAAGAPCAGIDRPHIGREYLAMRDHVMFGPGGQSDVVRWLGDLETDVKINLGPPLLSWPRRLLSCIGRLFRRRRGRR